MHSPIIQAAVAEAQRIIFQRDEGASIDEASSRSTTQQERRQREALFAGFQGISEQVKRKPGQRLVPERRETCLNAWGSSLGD